MLFKRQLYTGIVSKTALCQAVKRKATGTYAWYGLSVQTLVEPVTRLGVRILVAVSQSPARVCWNIETRKKENCTLFIII